jgi:nucleotide-binding universal stress UspA family protein
VYRNILVTTDGSDLAAAALPHAARILAPGGRVTVVEVIDDIGRIIARTTPAGFEFGSAFSPDIARQVVEAQRRAAEGHLAEAKQALEAAGATQVETLILEGLPADCIVGEAQARACDVVVMATHGRSGLRRAVLGSVADYVVRNLEGIPVLLVNPEG